MQVVLDKTEQKLKMRKRLINFTVSVIQLARRHERDRILAPTFNQIIRSAGSVGANVSEAVGSVSKVEYARYFTIALQSANETKYWLEVLKEFEHIDRNTLERLENEVVEFIRILTASLRTLRSRG